MDKLDQELKHERHNDDSCAKEIKEVILWSNSYLKLLDILPWNRFLVINLPGYCNKNCGWCRVKDIRKQTIFNDKYRIDELEMVLDAFKQNGWYTVWVMAYWESLEGHNIWEMKDVCKLTGQKGLFLIINTNGLWLNQQVIEELHKLNPNIVFQVSYDAGNKESYDKSSGTKNSRNKIHQNVDSWKDFIKNTDKIISIWDKQYLTKQFVIHTYVDKETIHQLDDIQKFAKEELNAALIVVEPGVVERIVSREEKIENINPDEVQNIKNTIKQYSSNKEWATAVLNWQCSYISQSDSYYNGITLYPSNGMDVTVCPYFKPLSFLNFREYLMKWWSDVQLRLSKANYFMKLVIDGIFDCLGKYYCLKRHRNESKITDFINLVSQKVEFDSKYVHQIDPKQKDYFDKIEIILKDVLKEFSKSDEQIEAELEETYSKVAHLINFRR